MKKKIQRILKLYRENGINQDQTASMLGIASATLSKILNKEGYIDKMQVVKRFELKKRVESILGNL